MISIDIWHTNHTKHNVHSVRIDIIMKFFDLFCGVGGFRLGMERNGHECVGSCEIDKHARQTYAKNFGQEPEFSDVTHINTNDIEDFDVLCAGFPCQAWSIAGLRKGFEDNRGDLFFQIVRIAREKQPTHLFLENVKGLLSHDKGASFREMLRTLDEVGYDLEWQIINSKYFVPQNRERLFIIGHFRGKSRGKILPLGFGHEESTTQSKIKILGNKNPSGRGQSGIIYDSNGLSPTLQAGTGEHQNSQGYIAVVKDHGKLRELKDNKSNMIGANYYKGPDNHGQRILVARAVLTPEREKRQNGRRMKEDGEPSFTVNTQDRHGVYDGLRVRRFTPLECERLQGFPDNWTEGVSDRHRFTQMGNAVTVNVIEYIASHFEKEERVDSYL